MTVGGPQTFDPDLDEQWLGYFQTLSNWGRWGPNDQLGTLNLIDPAKVASAASLVEFGRKISCARVVEFGRRVPEFEAVDRPLHFLTSTGARLTEDGAGSGHDWIGFPIHGLYMTHLDAPSHQFWRGTMYNGHPAASLTAERGAQIGSIELAGDGIVSRGLLLDIPASLGIEVLPEGYAITADELDAAAARQGVRPSPGDVVAIRTGYGRTRSKYRDQVPARASAPCLPGLSPKSLPWFRDHDVAVAGTDTGTESDTSDYRWAAPFHAVAMCAMGMWILDNLDLEEIAGACQEIARWSFLMMISPMRLRYATGSPVNPIAIL